MTLRGTSDVRQSGARTERELVEAAMAGNPDAFSDLAAAAATRLYAVARLIPRGRSGS